jgi:hypothetical protein
VILREATPDDLRPLMALCKKAWTQLGIRHDTTIDAFRDLHRQARLVVLYEGRDLLAGLGALRIDTADGPGFEVILLVVDQDHLDRLQLLDAISLFAANVARSEGARIVLSRRRRGLAAARYGRDFVGMTNIAGPTDDIRQVGDTDTIIQRIFERRPEWRTSL